MLALGVIETLLLYLLDGGGVAVHDSPGGGWGTLLYCGVCGNFRVILSRNL